MSGATTQLMSRWRAPMLEKLDVRGAAGPTASALHESNNPASDTKSR